MDTENESSFCILRSLGSGSYGNVYEVQQLETGKRYAMKKCRLKNKSNISVEYLHEIQLCHALKNNKDIKSNSILKYHSIVLTNNFIYIFMEWTNSTLEDLIYLATSENSKKYSSYGSRSWNEYLKTWLNQYNYDPQTQLLNNSLASLNVNERVYPSPCGPEKVQCIDTIDIDEENIDKKIKLDNKQYKKINPIPSIQQTTKQLFTFHFKPAPAHFSPYIQSDEEGKGMYRTPIVLGSCSVKKIEVDSRFIRHYLDEVQLLKEHKRQWAHIYLSDKSDKREREREREASEKLEKKEHIFSFIVQEIIFGVKELQKIGFMHGDLKPGNVLVNTGTNSIKVIDWNISKPYYRVVDSESYPTFIFTPIEFFSKMDLYHHAIDPWTIGCILGSLITSDDFLDKHLLKHVTDEELSNIEKEIQYTKPKKEEENETCGWAKFKKIDYYYQQIYLYVRGLHPCQKCTTLKLRRWEWKGTKMYNNCSDACLDFLIECFQFDSSKRYSIDHMIQHPFLKGQKSIQQKKNQLIDPKQFLLNDLFCSYIYDTLMINRLYILTRPISHFDYKSVYWYYRTNAMNALINTKNTVVDSTEIFILACHIMDRTIQSYAFSGIHAEHTNHCQNTIYISSFLDDLFVVSCILSNRLVLNKNYHTDSFKEYMEEEDINKWIYFILFVLQGQLDTCSHFSLMHLLCQLQYNLYWFDDYKYVTKTSRKNRDKHVLDCIRNQPDPKAYQLAQTISNYCFIILKVLYYFPSCLYYFHPIDLCLAILCCADQLVYEKEKEEHTFGLSPPLEFTLLNTWSYTEFSDNKKYTKKLLDIILILKACIVEAYVYKIIPSMETELTTLFSSLQLTNYKQKSLIGDIHPVVVQGPNMSSQPVCSSSIVVSSPSSSSSSHSSSSSSSESGDSSSSGSFFYASE